MPGPRHRGPGRAGPGGSEVADRPSARVGDRVQRLVETSRGACQVPGSLRLHDHRRHVVLHDVVQLAGEPRAFRGTSFLGYPGGAQPGADGSHEDQRRVVRLLRASARSSMSVGDFGLPPGRRRLARLLPSRRTQAGWAWAARGGGRRGGHASPVLCLTLSRFSRLSRCTQRLKLSDSGFFGR